MFVNLCHLDLRTLGVLGDVEGQQLHVLGDGGAGGGPRRQVVSRARHAPGGQTSNLRLRVLHGVNILRQRLGRRLLGVRSLNKREKLVSAWSNDSFPTLLPATTDVNTSSSYFRQDPKDDLHALNAALRSSAYF